MAVAQGLGRRPEVSTVASGTHPVSAVSPFACAANHTSIVAPRPAVDWLKLRTVKVVFGHVPREIGYLKVLRAIIRAVAVLVVDNLVAFKWATKDLLHNKAVFPDTAAIDTHPGVSVVFPSSTLPPRVLWPNAVATGLRRPRGLGATFGNTPALERAKLWRRRTFTTLRRELVIAGRTGHGI